MKLFFMDATDEDGCDLQLFVIAGDAISAMIQYQAWITKEELSKPEDDIVNVYELPVQDMDTNSSPRALEWEDLNWERYSFRTGQPYDPEARKKKKRT